MTTMKRIYTYAALALMALGFAGCQQEEDFALQGGEKELCIATRSTSDESAAEAFTEAFTLELWSVTDNSKHETHSMAYTEGTGWNTVKSSILPAHALAYKGKGVSATSPTAYTVTLQTDQSDATKLEEADVMIATGSASAESPLSLSFEHVFAKVTFNATLATGFDTSDVITSCTVKTTSEVKAFVKDGTISAIVAPGTYTEGSEFVSVTVGETSPLVVKVPEGGLTFEAGGHYTFPLKVNKKTTITFDTDGGSEVAPVWQVCDTDVTVPAAPTKDGHTFAGWVPAIPATMPEEDITVKATWTYVGYTVTWVDWNGTVLETDTGLDLGDTPVYNGAEPTRETKNGIIYTFKGWTPDVTTVTGSVTYTAEYSGMLKPVNPGHNEKE